MNEKLEMSGLMQNTAFTLQHRNAGMVPAPIKFAVQINTTRLRYEVFSFDRPFSPVPSVKV